MDYESLVFQVEQNNTLKLLRASNMPLIVGFLHEAFKQLGESQLTDSKAVELLSDYLFDIHERRGKTIYPKKEVDYLNDWTEAGYLSHRYLNYDDEPVYELTPSTERALQVLESLQKRDFIGTESRLTYILNMLEELSMGSTEDPEKKMEALLQQQAEIEKQIKDLKAGHIEPLDDTRIRERFFEIDDAIKRLLYDFKEVESNFRRLYESTREKIVKKQASKGKVLDEILKEHDFIYQSDQGKSFEAFWSLLMSQQKMELLDKTIQEVIELPALHTFGKSLNPVSRFKSQLIQAGKRVHDNNLLLIEQVRRFIEDQTLLENKRIGMLIKQVEAVALDIKEEPPKERDFFLLDNEKAVISDAVNRKMWQITDRGEVNSIVLDEPIPDVDISNLFDPTAVDEDVLRRNINYIKQQKGQASLNDIVEEFPIEKGLSEVLTYFQLGTTLANAYVDDEIMQEIKVYNFASEETYIVEVPQLIFA